MIVSSLNILPEVEGTKTLGAIFSQYTSGVNIVKDITGGIKAILGKRTSHYESDIKKAREEVLKDLTEQAEKLGGKAILGLNFQYSQLVDSNITIITIYGTGTVVSFD